MSGLHTYIVARDGCWQLFANDPTDRTLWSVRRKAREPGWRSFVVLNPNGSGPSPSKDFCPACIAAGKHTRYAEMIGGASRSRQHDRGACAESRANGSPLRSRRQGETGDRAPHQSTGKN